MMDDLVIGDWNKLTLKKTGEGVVLELHGVHKQDKTLKPYEVLKLRGWLNQLHLEAWIERDDCEVNNYTTDEGNTGDCPQRGGGDRWRRDLYRHYWEYEGSRHTAGE